MIIYRDVSAMREASRAARARKQCVGFVPTMGALHEGHFSLIRRAAAASDFLVVSIFVNPTQFGPSEDLATYPRSQEGDELACRRLGVDALFCPTTDAMYPVASTVSVTERGLSRVLCGAFRPGHFDGVLTVVAKLFHIVEPDIAVFGWKDAQQGLLIKRMVEQLNFDVEIVMSATQREADGLAMSSRNAYLSTQSRARATVVPGALCEAKRRYREGERDGDVITAAMEQLIANQEGVTAQYIAVVDMQSLQRVKRIEGSALCVLAVIVDGTRLIDNCRLGDAADEA